jgi:hypothetical protein
MLLGYRRDIACQTHRQHLLLRGGLGFYYRISQNDKNIFQHKHPIRWHSSVHAMSQRYRNTQQENKMLYIESIIKHTDDGVFVMTVLLPFNTAHERFFSSIEEAEAEVAAFNAFCSK